MDKLPKENKKVVGRRDQLRQIVKLKKKLKGIVIGLALVALSLYYFKVGDLGTLFPIVLALLAAFVYLLRLNVIEKNVKKSL